MGQWRRARGQFEAVVMLLHDPQALGEERKPLGRRHQFVKAELVKALRVRADRRAQVMRQQLRAQANSKKRLTAVEPTTDPIHLVLQEGMARGFVG